MHRLASPVASLALAAIASASPPPDAPPPDVPPGALDLDGLVAGNTQFALDLYAALRERSDENIAFSPQSISTALAMTLAGAGGETAAEMRRTLRFDRSSTPLPATFAALERAILAVDGGDAEGDENGGGAASVQLAIANRLWGQAGMPLEPAFLDVAREAYRGGFETVDFGGDTERARQTINAWVERHTNDRIRDLLRPGDVDPSTRLVLTNAIWFKGRWSTPFDPEATQEKTFHGAGGRREPAAMMTRVGRYRYFHDQRLQALELPYGGERFAMVVLLPRDRDGLADVEAALTAARLDAWLDRLDNGSPVRVVVQIPQFRTTARCDLAEILSAMGMPLAFSAGADFSGINGGRDLRIGRVVHQAFVEVNEEGTEAAAATGVMMPTSARPVRPPQFTADHPFVYLIRDRETGSVLFLGRLCDPGSGA